MPLTPGTRLGPYEVVAPIGVGGMGEVYRARDTRLDRTVAIKVLPPDVAQDPDRQARFEREAKAISQLTHPNICTLHDIGRDADTVFLVMEVLEGETLGARLEKGPLPLAETLRLGAEIASALDAAHRRGIVHRDLKPANVMLTKLGTSRSGVGTAKLLDFGLAKLRPAGPVAVEATAAPTRMGSATAQGTPLGTLPYMAPEQVEGRETDARTDIWALGCVLYEMAAGRRAFGATSQASLIGEIMAAEPPPLADAHPLTPPAFDRLVRTCLAKDPEDRWQSAADVRRELSWIAEQRQPAQSAAGGQRSAAAVVAAASPRRRFLRALGVVAVAVPTLGATAVITWLVAARLAPTVAPISFPIQLPDTIELASGGDAAQNPGVVSPDGRRIAFLANDQLFVGSLSLVDAKALPETDGASAPFWAPDSNSIAFFARGSLWRVDASGGAPKFVCNALAGRGGSWNRDGAMVASLTGPGPLFKIALQDGRLTPVTVLDPSRGEIGHRWPCFLPDGRHFLYFAIGRSSAVFVGSLDPEEPRKLLIDDAPTAATFAGGHLLFVRDNDLMAQRFDPKRLKLAGMPSRLVEDVANDPRRTAAFFGPGGAGGFSASSTGVLVYRPGRATSRLSVVDRASGVMTPLGVEGLLLDPAVSPDGTRVAYAKRESPTTAFDIWVLDLAPNRRPTKLTVAGGDNLAPLWTRDSRAIVFSSTRDGRTALYRKSALGPGPEDRLIEPERARYAYSWAPDGTLLGWEQNGASGEDIFSLALSGDRKPVTLVRTPANDADPAVSPDGKWLVYTSTEEGFYELYLTSYPSLNGRWAIPNTRGVDPVWSRTGREIFFVNSMSGALMSVDIDMGPPLQVGTPKVIHPGYVLWSSVHSFGVLGPDEKRFVVNIRDAGPITVTLNWPGLVQR